METDGPLVGLGIAGTPEDVGWRRPTLTRELLCRQAEREGLTTISISTMGRVLARLGRHDQNPRSLPTARATRRGVGRPSQVGHQTADCKRGGSFVREPWMLARAHSLLVAVPALDVLEITSDPEPRAVPRAPSHVRGLMQLHGRTFPLVDLRTCLGLPSARETLGELLGLFKEREKDHKRWMATLATAVAERQSFALALDPHQCAFGRWYDHYRSDNLLVTAHLKRIAAPHAALHARGGKALSLVAEGKQEQAMAMVESMRHGPFRQTVTLFEEAQRLVADETREVALVVRTAQGPLGLAVDAAEAVEEVHPLVAEGRTSPFVLGFAKRPRDAGMVTLLDIARVLASVGFPPAASSG
jgi:purine-binding chemotaxis protein CheW